jgi:phosphoglycolate phosphatase
MNQPFPFQIVGFDLDGTLLDTSGDLAAAMNHALNHVGRAAVPVEEVRHLVGRGAKVMLEQGLGRTGGMDEDLLKAAYPVLLDYYERNICVHSHAFAGMEAALERLSDQGVTLAVVTNKFERFAVKLLHEIGLAPRFATIIGGDTMGPGKAKPDAAPINEMIARCGGGRAAFVGDSTADTGAARNAGIPSVGVGFGFLNGTLADLAADATIDHFDELHDCLLRLG